MRKSTVQSRSRVKAFLIIGFCLPVGVVLFLWLLEMPDISALRAKNPTVTALMETRQAQAKAQGHTVERHWLWVPLSRISPFLHQAVVAAEDASFFTHEGFDWEGIKDAALYNLEAGELKRGGSTITQQLAKNLYLSSERSLLRKAREALITRSLENHLTKERILELYLNVAEWGQGVYGAEAAARHHFQKSARDLTADEAAWLAASLLAYTTRTWAFNTNYTEVGDGFNPEVGFLERSGYRFLSLHLLRHVRFANVAWLRELRPHVSYRGYWGYDGFNQTRNIHFDSHIELADGAFFSPAFNLTREGLQVPFEIDSGVVVPPGTYDNFEAAWRWNSNEGAPVSINGGLDWGGFLSGTRRGINNTLTVRAGAAFASSLRVSYNNLDLAEGSFSTALIALRLAYNFTPRMYLQSLVQYNEQAGSWSGNIRYGWLNTAGTGLFIVFNQSHAADRWYDVSGPLGRAVIVKFTRQFHVVL